MQLRYAKNFCLLCVGLCAFLMFFGVTPVISAQAQPPLPHESSVGYGGYVGPDSGGYTGPGPAVISVKEALQMEDGAWLALRGKITQSLGDKKYIFTDASGSVELHIGPREWNGQTVGPNDELEIHGKMHKDLMHSHIHVKRIIMQ